MDEANPDFRHDTPDALQALLDSEPVLRAKWDDLTELGRNEWICWTISPKQEGTRTKHLARLKDEVVAGKRRPCCWPGCPHRRASARKFLAG